MLSAIVAVKGSEYTDFETEVDAYSYTYTAHEVTTDDNYILTMFRITGKTNNSLTIDKPAVVIVHGNEMDGASWMRYQRTTMYRKPF